MEKNTPFSEDTLEVLGCMFDYVDKIQARKPLNRITLPKDASTILLELGQLRDCLVIPPTCSEDAIWISHYCFSMLRNFGVASFYDRHVLYFFEAIQLSKNRERYFKEFRFSVFPKSKTGKSKMQAAISKAAPRYRRVKSELIRLGFKKGFRNIDNGLMKLKATFPKAWKKLPQGVQDNERLRDLIRGKRVALLADLICASEFCISQSSFPKVRQQSKNLSARLIKS